MEEGLQAGGGGDVSALSEIAGALGEPLAFVALLSGALLLVGLPVFVAELWRTARSGELKRRRITGMLTSSFCLLPATLVEIVFAGALLGVFYLAAAFAPVTIPTTWATAVFCFFLADFVYYWEHRAAHEVNALWAAYHSVHHSGDHFDQTIAVRISFVDFFIAPLFYLPLVFAGFHPLLVFACLGLVLAWQQWIHTELVGKLPLLDPWLNTPSNHRVHHGRNDIYIDKNYGGVLMIWDRLFGTYARETEAVDYGLVDPLKSRHPWPVHFHVFGKLLSRLGKSRSVSEAGTVLFGRPKDG